MTSYLSTTEYSVAWIKRQADDELLDLHPPFQRNPVWVTKQKAFLIDTILRGYPVPELYIQATADEHGVERHIVVDGQQRIRACLEFAENELALDAEDSSEWADMRFDDLSKDDKQRFFGYKFVARLLPGMSDDELRAIFTRLNRNVVALNAQELRHATYWGSFIKLMEDLSSQEFWPTSGVFTAYDIRRMLDVEYVSELAVGLLHGPQNKKGSLEHWYAVYEESFEEERDVRSAFDRVIGETDQLLPELKSTRWSKKSDFYTLFLTLARFGERLPFARDERESVRAALMNFAHRVDSLIENPELETSPEVKRYTAAVARAASDLGSRRVRQDILKEVIEGALAS
jgi:hypothetical protein